MSIAYKASKELNRGSKFCVTMKYSAVIIFLDRFISINKGNLIYCIHYLVGAPGIVGRNRDIIGSNAD